MEEVGLEEELKEERVEKLDELVTQVVDQMMVPAMVCKCGRQPRWRAEKS